MDGQLLGCAFCAMLDVCFGFMRFLLTIWSCLYLSVRVLLEVSHTGRSKSACMKSVDAAIMQCAAIGSLLFHQHSSKSIKICPSEHCKALASSNAAAVPVAAMQSGMAGTGHAWLLGRALPKTSADV
jgi:hypothetical protein